MAGGGYPVLRSESLSDPALGSAILSFAISTPIPLSVLRTLGPHSLLSVD